MAHAPVVVISGAATGLGRRIAERFEEGGFRAHICDASAVAVAEFRTSHPQAAATPLAAAARELLTKFASIGGDIFPKPVPGARCGKAARVLGETLGL